MSEPKQPHSSPGLGFLSQLVGWGMVIAGGLLAFAGTGRQTSGSYVLLVLALAVVGAVLILRGRRFSTPVGEALDDRRPPVLYLRSFQDEDAAERAGAFFRDAFSGEQIAGDIPHSGPTEQYLLAQFFSTIGPYETIGCPGEVRPHAGARRIYKSEAEWQPYVLGLLGRARLILLHAGATPGLQWEVNRLVHTVNPSRVLLLMTGRHADYEAFLAWAGKAFPKPFPQKPGSRLMTFANDWTPAPLPLRPRLVETLAPWLGRNGIPAPKWSPFYRPRLS